MIAHLPVVVGFWAFCYCLATFQFKGPFSFRRKANADHKLAAVLATLAATIFVGTIMLLDVVVAD